LPTALADDEKSEEASREQAIQGVVIRIGDSKCSSPISPILSQPLYPRPGGSRRPECLLAGLDRLTLARKPTRNPTPETAEGPIWGKSGPYRQLSGARDRARWRAPLRGERVALAERSSAAPRRPHVGKEMLGLISLRIFDRGGHIDAFRSISGGSAGDGNREPARLIL